MMKCLVVGVCGTALLIAAAVVVALRERQAEPPPEVPVAQTPADVRVKAVERNPAAAVAAAALPARSRTIDLRGNVTHTGNLGSVPSRWLGGSVVRWLGSCANPAARDPHLEPRKRGSCPQSVHSGMSHYSQRTGEYYADCLRSRGVCPQVFDTEGKSQGGVYPR